MERKLNYLPKDADEIYKEYDIDKPRQNKDLSDYVKKNAKKIVEIMSASGYGCESPNWESNLWLCGLEWGVSGDGTTLELISPDCIQEQVKEHFSSYSRESDLAEYLNAYAYNKRLTRFFSYFYKRGLKKKGICKEKEMETPKSRADCLAKVGFLGENGFCTKLNLFPLPRKNHVAWTKLDAVYCSDVSQTKEKKIGKMQEVFGNYYDYLDSSVKGRIKLFQRKLLENAKNKIPTVVICFGLSEEENFIKSFGADKNEKYQLMYDKTTECGRIYPINSFAEDLEEVINKNNIDLKNDQLWLIVFPFIQRPPIGRYDTMEDVIGKAQNYLKEKGCPAFWEDLKPSYRQN